MLSISQMWKYNPDSQAWKLILKCVVTWCWLINNFSSWDLKLGCCWWLSKTLWRKIIQLQTKLSTHESLMKIINLTTLSPQFDPAWPGFSIFAQASTLCFCPVFVMTILCPLSIFFLSFFFFFNSCLSIPSILLDIFFQLRMNGAQC